MADEEFDLGDDEDLDLGDDEGGDDFAGSLDDMMGDEDLGDDAGDSDDNDSELDSFFEDLSSIDSGDTDEPAPAPMAAPAAPAQAAPQAAAAPKPAAAPKAPGSKKKLIIIAAAVLVVLLAGGGAFWFFSGDEQDEMVQKEPPKENLFKENPITVEPVKPAAPMAMPAPMPKFVPAPMPQQVVKKPEPRVEPEIPRSELMYLVQVAICSFDRCKEDYTKEIRSMGEPVYHKDTGDKYDFIELVTRDLYTYREATRMAEEINLQNKQAGRATVVFQTNGYRVTMGTFPALDRAKEVKAYVEKLLPQAGLNFNLEHVRKEYDTTKVYAGPYKTIGLARQVLKEFQLQHRFQGAFIVKL